MFLRKISPPPSGSKSKPSKEPVRSSCLDYFSTLMMEPVCSSATSMDFYQTAHHYIPEGSTAMRISSEERILKWLK
jgi:hypothetical protein